MTRWAASIGALGEQLGLPGFVLSERGCAAMQLQSGRRIAFEAKQDQCLLYVSEPVPYDGPERLIRAWRQSHFSQARGARPVQAALRDQEGLTRLLVVVRLCQREQSVQELRAAVEYLLRWLDATRNG